MGGYQSSRAVGGFQQTGDTAAIPATTSSANAALENNTPGYEAMPISQVQVWNSGTTGVFIRFGNSAIAATSTGYPVAPGAVVVVTPPDDATHVAVIAISGTPTVYFTPGVGL